MKTLIAVFLFAPLFASAAATAQDKPQAQEKEAEKTQSKPAARPAVKELAMPEGGLPPDAVQVDANMWHWKAPDGKMWLYRKTAFGLSRGVIEEKLKQAEEIPPGMIATDAGDSVRFERSSPFGPMKWTRPKSELTELEQLVWERDRKKAAASGAEAKPAPGSEKETAGKDKAKQ